MEDGQQGRRPCHTVGHVVDSGRGCPRGGRQPTDPLVIRLP